MEGYDGADRGGDDDAFDVWLLERCTQDTDCAFDGRRDECCLKVSMLEYNDRQ